MLCESCKENEATITAKTMVNGQVTVRRLCESCLEAEDFELPIDEDSLAAPEKPPAPAQYDLESLKNLIGAPESRAPGDLACPDCGMTLAEFRKRRVVGCARDYEIFGEEMRELLGRLHADQQHCGKVPRSIEMRRVREHRARQLRDELATAIDSELYEEAARLRDRIQALEEAGDEGDR